MLANNFTVELQSVVLVVSTITLAESDSSSACEGHNRVK